MVQALEVQRAAYERRDGVRAARIADISDALSDDRGQKVRAWVAKNGEAHRDFGRGCTHPIQVAFLAVLVATRRPVSAWEMLLRKEREERVRAISSAARELSRLMELPDSPPPPSALLLFDPENVPQQLHQGLRASSTPAELRPLQAQELSPMLQRLAAQAEQSMHARVRDARPRTGSASARVLARALADWFETKYLVVPKAVIAELINLAMPSLDDPVDKTHIRDWLRPPGV